jgi:hypothetical protein
MCGCATRLCVSAGGTSGCRWICDLDFVGCSPPVDSGITELALEGGNKVGSISGKDVRGGKASNGTGSGRSGSK